MTRRNLQFEIILFEFIEPLVILYKSGKTFFVASALPSDVGYVTEYLVVSVSPKIFKRYAREDVDLRYLFVSSASRTFWKMNAADVGKASVRVDLFEGVITEEMLPDPQFFASSHTGQYQAINQHHGGEETLFIDGNWEMEDFGSFSRKFRDLYAFEDSLNKALDSNTPEGQRKRIADAFKNNTLHGGGSYVGFFADLTRTLPANDRYELKKVQYASPGEIKLNGKGAIFDALEVHIKKMVGAEQSLNEKYRTLYDFMSRRKLLDISGPVRNASLPDQRHIELKAKSLLKAMGFDCYETIQTLTDGSVTNNAKITMALYRRLKDASAYFAEGRAAYER